MSFSTGWNEAHDHAANYTFTDGVISSQPRIGGSFFTPTREVRLSRALAWRGARSATSTVFAPVLAYTTTCRTRWGTARIKNAPFNPVFSIPELSGVLLPRRIRRPPVPATAKLVPAGFSPT